MTNTDMLLKLWDSDKCNANCPNDCCKCERNIWYQRIKNELEFVNMVRDSVQFIYGDQIILTDKDSNKCRQLVEKLMEVIKNEE